ncbi:efflux RND transporter periplasmic adaptor subunit [Halopseudomonas salegens]|uniref:HlyD family secretion protein n=1 Tax=Halopseudomonas salegens TaxID=1434072 RepID=A0A1H2E5A2_9GAMM|nr:HlyD family efflux transporter periplasmic adaptor subunit [Halopseudomonas salegens]SDT90392.1 HlyD family secretion protein [Halopseudomonas salegens]
MSDKVAALLGLEQQLRKASDLAQLFYTLVNQTGQCVPYVQSVLAQGSALDALSVVAASDVPTVDFTAPYIVWVERVIKYQVGSGLAAQQAILTADDLPDNVADDWRAFGLPPFLLWQPLPVEAREGSIAGVHLLFNDRRWSEAELGISQHLAASAGHALFALRQQNPWQGWRPRWRNRRRNWIILAMLAALMFWPVRVSVLAPAQIIAREPWVATAPLDGAVDRVMVEPNQAVAEGEVLANLQTSDLASAAELADQALLLAEAELKTVQQSGFLDPRQKSRLAELETTVRMREIEREYAHQRLQRASIRAAVPGVVVLDDPAAWSGRPVQTGERILLVADPQRVEIEIRLPVKDAIALEEQAAVRLFLDRAPLQPLSGQLRHAAYEPSEDSGQQMFYRLVASLDASAEPLPRLGMRGTAKVYGERVTLFFYLFRRPITAARQWMGW